MARTPQFLTIKRPIGRDHRGWTKELIYQNNTGRNDIINAKVARDAQNLVFYVQTREPLTPSTDPNWIMLFLDADQNSVTGWHGYDVRVWGGQIEIWENGAWEKAGPAKMAVGANELELELPRNLIARAGADLSFDFKWADNVDPDDIDSWFVDGDVAPNRRFNYRYLARP